MKYIIIILPFIFSMALIAAGLWLKSGIRPGWVRTEAYVRDVAVHRKRFFGADAVMEIPVLEYTFGGRKYITAVSRRMMNVPQFIKGQRAMVLVCKRRPEKIKPSGSGRVFSSALVFGGVWILIAYAALVLQHCKGA